MQRVLLSDDADTPLLLFLWQWKLSTTAALSLKFYPNRTPKKAYYRLLELEKGGFIQSRRDVRTPRYVWLLTKKGFSSILGYLPTLREEGFASEHLGHDLLVTAFHLGNRLLDGAEIELFSEQQLRRCALEQYPNWVPTTELHRPDGYWRIVLPCGTGQTVALEVELKEKGPTQYAEASRFYEYYSMIERVIWLTRTPSASERILTRLKLESPETNKHSFVSFADFFQSGWECKVSCGSSAGATVSVLLGYQRGTAGLPVPSQYLLNVSKSPHKAKASLFYRPGDFFR